MTPPQINLLCVLTLCLGLIGSNNAQAKSDKHNNLKVTPEICITSNDEQTCEITLELQWELSNDELVCILSDNPAYPKWCNDSLNQRTVNIKVSTSTDIQFVMVSKESNQTLAGAKLKITSTSQPQVRRRYRNPWSLF